MAKSGRKYTYNGRAAATAAQAAAEDAGVDPGGLRTSDRNHHGQRAAQSGPHPQLRDQAPQADRSQPGIRSPGPPGRRRREVGHGGDDDAEDDEVVEQGRAPPAGLRRRPGSETSGDASVGR